MQLIYRGTTYDYDPAQAKVDHRPQRTAPYELSYRGNRYRIDPMIAESAATTPRSYELMYRGNTYQVTRNEFGETTAITCATKFLQPQTLKPHAAIPKVADQHLR
jgi:Domain of unknown function (DUF4278)